jgi:hypothetical protein
MWNLFFLLFLFFIAYPRRPEHVMRACAKFIARQSVGRLEVFPKSLAVRRLK